VNITCWPKQAYIRGLEVPKASYLRTSTAHVQIAGETHTRGADEQSMARHLASDKWKVWSAQAESSDLSEEGTWGGVAMQVRKYLSLSPVAGSVQLDNCWRCSSSAYWTAATIHVGKTPLLVFGGYCRGGIQSMEGLEVLNALCNLSAKGSRPFVALCDWNATMEEVESSGWLQILSARTCSSGKVTAVSREVDFAIISADLGKAWIGCEINRAVPYSPHSAFRLVLSRAADDLTKIVPRKPKPLPVIGAETLCSVSSLERWRDIRLAKSGWAPSKLGLVSSALGGPALEVRPSSFRPGGVNDRNATGRDSEVLGSRRSQGDKMDDTQHIEPLVPPMPWQSVGGTMYVTPCQQPMQPLLIN
jgi:hypothetical protein